MESIKATWTGGQIVPNEPVAWPEGTELVVEPSNSYASPGLQESQWRSDAKSIAEWEAWVATLEPRILTEQEQADLAAFEAEQRRFNLDAVQRQMADGERQ